jgi:hypothetical protein
MSQDIHGGTKSVATHHNSNLNTNSSALQLSQVASSASLGRVGV